MKPLALAVMAVLMMVVPMSAQVCNLKVVTDASPDYHDMPSMVNSITANWKENKDKCWALFYWNHIGRRQTTPMILHGVHVSDPITQFNDYGYTLCSTIAGINTATWDFMGLPSRYYEIGLHTVSEVKYDGRYHLYDNSLSAIYTLCDGKTIAGIEDVGADGACEASGGKKEPGHIAKYHCLSATSENGFLSGADCARTLESEAEAFAPKNLKHQYFNRCADYGNRYVLNLREAEVYTRYYRRLDADSSKATTQSGSAEHPSDPAYFVSGEGWNGKDLEAFNPRYRIRGNGIRAWNPPLTAQSLSKVACSVSGAVAMQAGGVSPAEAGKTGEVVFKVEGANVITSLKINASMLRETADDAASIAISVSGGRQWKEIWQAREVGASSAKLELIGEVNGSYDVLVRVQLTGKTRADAAQLKSIAFEALTQVNSKTQPKLNIGKNTVYVGAGDQTESIILQPDLRDGRHDPYIHQKENLASVAQADVGRYPLMYIQDAAVPKGWIVFKVDAPADITRITYGGRLCVRAPGAFIYLMHSFDGGKTWEETYSLKDTTPPWDVTHFETRDKIPVGIRSVLFKYYLWSPEGTPAMCGLYSVRMEVHHKVADPGFKPVEVTFTWKERQADYSLVQRSHTQVVDKSPSVYTINVGGADHPVMESLRVNLRGAGGEVKPGYSDGKDVGGEKWVGRWVTYGRNLAEGKPYICSEESLTVWGAQGTKLTDGVVGASYGLGSAYSYGALWQKGEPTITVKLDRSEKCGAFRIHLHGYPRADAIKGEIKDQVEVLTSPDGVEFTSQGFFSLNLRWKDLPVNLMWNDEETFEAHNHELILAKPVEARYVRFKLKPARTLGVTEVQVLDGIKYEPFDLKLALPKDAPK